MNRYGKAVWRCKYCRKEYQETSGTAVVTTHLSDAHAIAITSMQAMKTLSRQSNISEAFQRGQGDYKRRCLSTVDTQTLDPAVLEHLYIRWIVSCGVSFRMASREEFRTLLQYLNPEVNNWLPHSTTTIQLWTIRTYDTEKLRIQQKVQSALSKVHFTVDLWTSPNSLAIIGIIGHYIAENGDLQHSVLALQELNGEHTGQNQAESIMEVINDYGIASKVGYFMMDNASNNDTMIEALSTRTYKQFISHITGLQYIYRLYFHFVVYNTC